MARPQGGGGEGKGRADNFFWSSKKKFPQKNVATKLDGVGGGPLKKNFFLRLRYATLRYKYPVFNRITFPENYIHNFLIPEYQSRNFGESFYVHSTHGTYIIRL